QSVASVGADLARAISSRPPGGAGAGGPELRGGADAALTFPRGVRRAGPPVAGGRFLSKEVIQPQVPLRLPCYDLVPITGFTFGACPCGRRRLRVPPALVA